MFRDKEEELQRLQEELLEQEEPEEVPEETEDTEDLLDEDVLEELLQDTRAAEDDGVYQNYSNEYGKQLRNFASGYRAYNSDKVDTDLEEFSRQVEEPKRHTGLLVVAALLTVAVLALVGYLWLQYRGAL